MKKSLALVLVLALAFALAAPAFATGDLPKAILTPAAEKQDDGSYRFTVSINEGVQAAASAMTITYDHTALKATGIVCGSVLGGTDDGVGDGQATTDVWLQGVQPVALHPDAGFAYHAVW